MSDPRDPRTNPADPRYPDLRKPADPRYPKTGDVNQPATLTAPPRMGDPSQSPCNGRLGDYHLAGPVVGGLLYVSSDGLDGVICPVGTATGVMVNPNTGRPYTLSDINPNTGRTYTQAELNALTPLSGVQPYPVTNPATGHPYTVADVNPNTGKLYTQAELNALTGLASGLSRLGHPYTVADVNPATGRVYTQAELDARVGPVVNPNTGRPYTLSDVNPATGKLYTQAELNAIA
jgi:hypothetical protein